MTDDKPSGELSDQSQQNSQDSVSDKSRSDKSRQDDTISR